MIRRLQLFAFAILLVSLPLGLHGASIAIAPANPTLGVGQRLQLTADGAVTPSAVATGAWHTCVLFSDQSVRCTGRNNLGEIGDGTFNNAFSPVLVGGLVNPISIRTGNEHTCALMADGTMQCWGTNYTGQLGDGTIGGYAERPQPVHGIGNAIEAVPGGYHTCAVLSDHTVQCWGRNQDGQIGNGDRTTDVTLPQPVTGLGPVAALTAGGYHTCALMPDSTVQCWGRNDDGQLGNATRTTSTTPVPVSGIAQVVAITGGGYHTCALLADHTVQCWGQNYYGQIGSPNLAFSSVPVTVSGITNAAAVVGGFFHTCAILSDGTARCWGRNDFGALGDGTTTNSSVPVQVRGIANPSAIAAGGAHTCALMPDRSVLCWGENDFGELGNGTAANASTPVQMNGSGITWVSSNTNVVTVDATGLATAIAAGTATISVSDGFGNSASTTLTVGNQRLFTLSVALNGSGNGSVTSTPDGINCGSVCSASYAAGTAVTLTATPAGSSLFANWSGCDTTSGTTCTVAMNAARSVTATFNTQMQTYTLAASKAGDGSGTVTSSPAGIDCGATCSAGFPSGTNVTLTASAVPGSVFAGWSGCDASSGARCTVTMSASRSVTAAFNLQRVTLIVSKTGDGSGTIVSSPSGIACGTTCSADFTTDTTVTLVATAGPRSVFGGWSGCDAISGTSCTVTMSTARSAIATFSLQRFTLSTNKTGDGIGTLTSSPAGINCGPTCSARFVIDTPITLTAAPAAGSLFTGWSGCDSVSGAACTVTMSAARSVTARFNLQRFTLTVGKTGLGSGIVTSSPAGIDCGSTCSASFVSGTSITLTADPGLLSGFGGWSGCDTTSGTSCTVDISAARSVIARFNLLGLL